MKVWDQARVELATPGSAVRLASVARHVTDCATRPEKGGYPLNISPLPTVQNSSKVIHSQNLFTQKKFDKSLLFENPTIAYLIYDEKHGGFPSQKLVMCK